MRSKPKARMTKREVLDEIQFMARQANFADKIDDEVIRSRWLNHLRRFLNQHEQFFKEERDER